jgi:hypothetical protein
VPSLLPEAAVRCAREHRSAPWPGVWASSQLIHLIFAVRVFVIKNLN